MNSESVKLQVLKGLRPATPPERYRNHPLVKGQYFYTIPDEFLELLERNGGCEKMDSSLLDLEFALSRRLGDHGYYAGFVNGHLLPYEFLGERKPLDLSEEDAGRIGLDKKLLKEFNETASRRLDTFGLPLRGYVGWLLTNREFLEDHDDLFMRNRDRIIRDGIPKPIAVTLALAETVNRETSQSEPATFVVEFQQFCQRWRLQTFVGPYLPVPIAPQIPDPFARPEGLGGYPETTSFTLPDIFPVSNRGEFSSAIDDAVHGDHAPSHLTSWMAIIDSSNSAKNQISRFSRLFRFQHFVRVLYSRHHAALSRKKSCILESFEEFFQVSKDTVKADWNFMVDRVGDGWHLRADPLQ